jgi:hypothetical protein
MKTKEEIIENLKSGICRVVFTKKNGDEREMNCTLSSVYLKQVIPATDTPKKERKTPTTDVISVFDVEANGWRAFNASNVTVFEFVSP